MEPINEQNRRRFFWERMGQWGVEAFSAIQATASMACSARINRADDKFEFIQARHEEMAAFMASAYAKFTGELGVCIATQVRAPRICSLVSMTPSSITCRCWRSRAAGAHRARRRIISRNSTCQSLFKDVAGAFVEQASAPAQVRHLIDRAIRIAIGRAQGRGADLAE